MIKFRNKFDVNQICKELEGENRGIGKLTEKKEKGKLGKSLGKKEEKN